MEFGFFLKKFITFFVEPFGMVLIAFAVGFYFLFKAKYRVAKAFLGFAIVLLLLFSYHPFSNFLVKNLENKYPKYGYKEKVKYIHVLGSGHNTDDSQPLSSQVSSKRVLEGVIIHLQTPNSKLIFTGYEGDTNISNAQMNASLAIALGVKTENIIVNPKPRDTREEAVFTKGLIGDEAFVLVTSASHMPRSMKLFQSFGLNPIPAPTDFHKRDANGYFKAPDIDYLLNSKIAMHEYFGILWSMLKK